MPTFQLNIPCKCGHRFTAVIRTRGDDPPGKRYTVICPMNGSSYTFRVGDLRKVATELPADAVEARPAVAVPSVATEEWQPDLPVPWYTRPPYPALLFAAVLLALALCAWAGLAVLKGWR